MPRAKKPAIVEDDDDDAVFEPELPRPKPKKQKPKKQKSDSGSDGAWEPSGSEDEEEEDGSQDNDDSGSEVAAPRTKAKRRRAPARKPAPPPAETTCLPCESSASASSERPPTHTGSYVVEHAKTGRAKCKVCGEAIALRALRVGIEVEEKGWGIITRWQHVACTRMPWLSGAAELDGYDDLLAPEQAQIDEMLKERGAPAHLSALDPDAEVAKAGNAWTESREPPPELLGTMLPYQKEGLAWLCKQEEGEVKGGILADEMGMGKTLQTISLLVAHKQKERKSSSTLTDGLPSGGNLIIVPVIALTQWRAELLRWTADGLVSIYFYHGPKRQLPPAELAKYDVVLTTYATLEYDYRAAQAGSMVACAYCSKKFKSDQKLAFHNRWFCGPNAKRSAAQSKTDSKKKKKTATRTAADDDSDSDDDSEDDDDESEEESEDEAPKKKGVKRPPPKAKAATKAAAKKPKGKEDKGPKGKAAAKPKGKGKAPPAAKGKKAAEAAKGAKAAKGKRTAVPDDDDDDDDDESDDDDDDDEDEEEEEEEGGGLSAMARAAKAKGEKRARAAAASTLHRVHWQRIVLDEAHAIKDRRCSTAQAAFALAATFRWCLSGTPLQNRVGEFYSLVQFLRLDPYCYYFCKAKVDGGTCTCKCREYNFDSEWRYCRDCGHTPLQHYSLFNRDIVNPIRKFGYVGAGRSGFLSLKRGVLDKCLLRRTKAGRADEMVLPPKLITLGCNFLDAREADFYNALCVT